MTKRFCFVFTVFCLTAVLIFAVYLRSANSRIFYKLCAVSNEKGRLKQQLAGKQLQVENLINPSAISKQLGK
jgi:hypothetical protein